MAWGLWLPRLMTIIKTITITYLVARNMIQLDKLTHLDDGYVYLKQSYTTGCKDSCVTKCCLHMYMVPYIKEWNVPCECRLF